MTETENKHTHHHHIKHDLYSILIGAKWSRCVAAEHDYRETSVISSPLNVTDGQWLWSSSVFQLTAESFWVEAAQQGSI